jgi:hypothetical protein
MILPPNSEFVRSVSTPNALHIILKNTHFKNDLINDALKLHIEYSFEAAILVFNFSEPYYGFSETLKYGSIEGQDWLKADRIVISISIADSVIADQLTNKEFILDEQESAALRSHVQSNKSNKAF